MFYHLYWTQTHSSMPMWADAHRDAFISVSTLENSRGWERVVTWEV